MKRAAVVTIAAFLCAGARKEISSFAARTPRGQGKMALPCSIAHGRPVRGQGKCPDIMRKEKKRCRFTKS